MKESPEVLALRKALKLMLIQFNGNVPGMTAQQVFDFAAEALAAFEGEGE